MSPGGDPGIAVASWLTHAQPRHARARTRRARARERRAGARDRRDAAEIHVMPPSIGFIISGGTRMPPSIGLIISGGTRVSPSIGFAISDGITHISLASGP